MGAQSMLTLHDTPAEDSSTPELLRLPTNAPSPMRLLKGSACMSPVCASELLASATNQGNEPSKMPLCCVIPWQGGEVLNAALPVAAQIPECY